MSDRCLVFIVDVSNVIRARSGGGTPCLKDLDRIDSEIQCRWPGAIVRRIADASLKHRIRELEPQEILRFDQMLKSDHVVQVPAGTRADDFVIKEATWFGGYMITNDKYDKEERAIAPETVVPERMVKVYFAGEVVDLVVKSEPVPLPGSEKAPRAGGLPQTAVSDASGAQAVEFFCDEWETTENSLKRFKTFNIWLHDSIVDDDIEGLRILLELDVDLDTRWNPAGATFLHFAAQLGRAEVARVLLEYGADADIRGADGFTPLMIAAVGGNLDVARVLLDGGAEVDAVDGGGLTALHFALSNEEVELALNRGEDELEAAMRRHTAPEERLQLTRLLLDRGADVNHLNNLGTPPIQTAVALADPALVGILLASGARLGPCSGGYTLLVIAAQNGYAEIVQMLLMSGADPNETRPPENSSVSPIGAATFNGHPEVVRMLAANGADVNMRAIDNVTPLIMAAAKGLREEARVLVSIGADVSLTDSQGWNAVSHAARNQDAAMVSLLQDAHAGRIPRARMAGFCSACNANVWLNPSGTCSHGHPAATVSGRYYPEL